MNVIKNGNVTKVNPELYPQIPYAQRITQPVSVEQSRYILGIADKLIPVTAVVYPNSAKITVSRENRHIVAGLLNDSIIRPALESLIGEGYSIHYLKAENGELKRGIVNDVTGERLVFDDLNEAFRHFQEISVQNQLAEAVQTVKEEEKQYTIENLERLTADLREAYALDNEEAARQIRAELAAEVSEPDMDNISFIAEPYSDLSMPEMSAKIKETESIILSASRSNDLDSLSSAVRERDVLKAAYERAYNAYIEREKENKTNGSGVQQESAKTEKSFEEQVDDVLAGKAQNNYDNSIKLSDTPDVLLKLGFEKLPMLYSKQHLLDAVKPKTADNPHAHGLTREQILAVPELLKEPVCIFDSISPKPNNSVVAILCAVDNDRSPIFVSIKPNGKGIYQLENISANYTTSIYGKDNNFTGYLERVIKSGNLLYVDKEKVEQLSSLLGLQLSLRFDSLDFANLGSRIIIHQSRNIVKSFSENSRNVSVDEAKAEQSSDTSESTGKKSKNGKYDIIGNTKFRFVPDKTRTDPIPNDEAGQELLKRIENIDGLKYSGRTGDDIVLTVNGQENKELIESIYRSVLEEQGRIISETHTETPQEKTFAEQIHEVLHGTPNRYDDLKVCDTPKILQYIGCDDLPMLYTKEHLRKAVKPKDVHKHQHGLTEEFLATVPELMAEPVMVLDSMTRDDSLLVVLSSKETDPDNAPIVASVFPNGQGKYEMQLMPSNFVTSIYGRDNFETFINKCAEEDKILFADKEKSQELFSVLRLQFPQGFNNLSFNTIIHPSRNIVKPFVENISDIEQKNAPEAEKPETATYRHGEERVVNEPVRDEQYFLEQAKNAINDFCVSEYSSEADFSDMSNVNVAYTTIVEIDSKPLDEELELQVSVDLENYAINSYVDGDLLHSEKYDSIEAMLPTLNNLGFSELTSTIDYEEEIQSMLADKQAERAIDINEALADPIGSPEEKAELQRELDSEHINDDGQVSMFGNEEIAEANREQRQKEHKGAPVQGVTQNQPTDNLSTRVDKSTVKSVNYRSSPDDVHETTPKKRFAANAEAIKTLKAIEKEGRTATPEEQKILAGYTGWGGLTAAFEMDNPSWANEYAKLQGLLTDEEYANARATVLDAFYTSNEVISAIYSALDKIGFKGGSILEPSMGVGNFFGMLPESMQGSKLTGVEIDDLTGRIAKQLYPQAEIHIKGLQETNLRNNSFDVAVGNVPFGETRIYDRDHRNENFLIHDYFFAKALDKVHPGGVVAFITSKGTMDKDNPEVREYLSRIAEFVGAVRLPNNAFTGTQTATDIIFLKKRERELSAPDKSEWIYKEGETEKAYSGQINEYFVQHPEMICGRLEEVSTRFGSDIQCVSDGRPLSEHLERALSALPGNIFEHSRETAASAEDVVLAPADANKFEFYNLNGILYYRDQSDYLTKAEVYNPKLKPKQLERALALIELRDVVRELLDLQLNNSTGAFNADIDSTRQKLNDLYDKYVKDHGNISSEGSRRSFRADDSYPLLCSLENKNSDGMVTGKSDIFFKNTVSPKQIIDHVDTAEDALALSVAEKGRVDFEYMTEVSGIPKESLIEHLKGQIYRLPSLDYERYVTADEYLSGNIRNKIRQLDAFPDGIIDKEAQRKALEDVLPARIEAADIKYRLGATWIPAEYLNKFICEHFEPDVYSQSKLESTYSKAIGEWKIDNVEPVAKRNVAATNKYGTERMNAYEILERILNSRHVIVKDYAGDDENGKPIYVVNEEQTKLAKQKEKLINNAFNDWLFKDRERRERLVDRYNELFNSIRPREYDGAKLHFEGMNPEIKLEPHQLRAIARAIYNDNAYFAHAVGAGKTFEMIATAMEKKRLGLCKKSLIAVPNALTAQVGADFRKLYPTAKILVATEKDFETKNRKMLLAKMAVNDYDAVIVGHTQFDRMGLSPEKEKEYINKELDDMREALVAAKYAARAKGHSDKQDMLRDMGIERFDEWAKDFGDVVVDWELKPESNGTFQLRTRFSQFTNLPELMTAVKETMDIITSDQLTIDKPKKNTHNVVAKPSKEQRRAVKKLGKRAERIRGGGVDPRDDNMLCITNDGRKIGLDMRLINPKSPDNPDSKVNLCVRNVLDIFNKTAEKRSTQLIFCDMSTPKPESRCNNVFVYRKTYSEDSINGYEMTRKMLDVSRNDLKYDKIVAHIGKEAQTEEDNLKDGDIVVIRKPSEDMKTIISEPLVFQNGELLPIEQPEADMRLEEVGITQNEPMPPKPFNVYDDIKSKLIAQGVPENEIAFIHDYDTAEKKKQLYDKMNEGEVRILLGSTSKCGAGMNAQKKMCAIHHLDMPLRPRDLEQRDGRGERRGNENKEIDVFRYITEDTFDAYLAQIVENKLKFIGQIMTSKTPQRVAEDIDDAVMEIAAVKALAQSNPLIREEMTLRSEIADLTLLKNAHKQEIYSLQNKLESMPKTIENYSEIAEGYRTDHQAANAESPDEETGTYPITIMDKTYDGKDCKKEAGTALYNAIMHNIKDLHSWHKVPVGTYRGMELSVKAEKDFYSLSGDWQYAYKGVLKGKSGREYNFGLNLEGAEKGDTSRTTRNITAMDKLIDGFKENAEKYRSLAENGEKDIEKIRAELDKPFTEEGELEKKEARLVEVRELLTTMSIKDDKPRKDLFERLCDTFPAIMEGDAYEEEYSCILPDIREDSIKLYVNGDTLTLDIKKDVKSLLINPAQEIKLKLDFENKSLIPYSFKNGDVDPLTIDPDAEIVEDTANFINNIVDRIDDMLDDAQLALVYSDPDEYDLEKEEIYSGSGEIGA